MKNEKVRRTRAEWIALIDACACSGLGRREFAEREGLSTRTFSWWASKLAPSRATHVAPCVRGEPAFVRVVPTSVSGTKVAAPRGSSHVELVLSNGRVLRCDLEHASDERLVSLIALAERTAAC